MLTENHLIGSDVEATYVALEAVQVPKAYSDKQKIKLLDRVYELTIEGNSPEAIGKLIDRDIVSVYTYQNILADEKRLEKNPNSNRLLLYEAIENKGSYIPLNKKAFMRIPIIKAYLEKKQIESDKPSFKKLVNNHVSRLCVFCNTIQVHPETIINEPNLVESLGKYMLQFREKLNSSQVKYIRPNNARIKKDGKSVSHQDYSRAWASLCETMGKKLPEVKDTHILNRSRRTQQGDYSNVYLSYNVFRQGIDFCRRYGEKYVALYLLMVEIFPRSNSIFTNPIDIKMEWAEVDGKEYAYGLISEWYEAKQESKFPKIIIDPEVLVLVQNLIPKGTQIFTENIEQEKQKFNDILRAFYVSVGLLPRDLLDDNGNVKTINDPTRPVFKKKTKEYYIDLEPTYTLRHTGATFCCYRCNFDLRKVAKLGWKKMDTVATHYVTEPITNFFKQTKCMYCNPPKNESEIPPFCCFDHALIWFHTRKPKVEATISSVPEMQNIEQIEVEEPIKEPLENLGTILQEHGVLVNEQSEIIPTEPMPEMIAMPTNLMLPAPIE